jgi:DNA polymerase (family X)
LKNPKEAVPVHNSDIAEIFNNPADIPEIEGVSQLRDRTYRNAARVVGELPFFAASLVERKEDLTQLPGIGKDLAQKISEIVYTGTLSQLRSMEDSKGAIHDKRIREIRDFGKKIEEIIAE